MSRRQRLFAGFALFGCSLYFLLPSTDALAKPGYRVEPGSFNLELALPSSHGYSLSIAASDHRHVELEASKGGRFVTYSTLGRAGSRRVKADFGSLGRVDLNIRLKPGNQGALFPPPDNCKGRQVTALIGSFRGTVDFHGEGAVPAASTHRGIAWFERHYRQVCKRGSHRHRRRHSQGKPGKGVEIALLSAESHPDGRTVDFQQVSFSLEGLSLSVAFASLAERLGRVQITRTALEIVEGSAIRLSKPDVDPETARVALPRPFSGRATYSHSPGAPPTWTGTLAVHLPGGGLVPLAGPEFTARLCRGSSAVQLKPCEPKPDSSGSGRATRLMLPATAPPPLPLRARAWRAALRSARLR